MMLTVFLYISLLPRIYHPVPLKNLALTRWTHVETCGEVVSTRKMKDGDWHITLVWGQAKAVMEIIPKLPLDPPRKGQRIRVRGISRYDKRHHFFEIHPVESWEPVQACK